MSNFKLFGISIFLSLLLTASAIDFGDDSSCESSEEHGYGGNGHGHGHGHNHGRPPRPPAPPPPAPPPPRPPPPRPPTPPRPPPPRPKCGQGWYTSYRPQGIWCLRVGIGHMDYNGAISQCATYGGVLSGIQNNWERMLLANEANRQTLAYNIHYSGMWLGAQRNPGTNTFRWTDGHTTGNAALVFGPGQPDNTHRNGRGSQNCLQLISLAPGYWNNPGLWRGFRNGQIDNPGFWRNWQNGQIDDYWCNQVKNPNNRMYACGKRGPRG